MDDRNTKQWCNCNIKHYRYGRCGYQGNTITNTITVVSADQTDSNTTADDPSEDIVVGNDADLVTGKTVNNGTPNEGDTIIYTLTLTNNGPAQATNL